MHLKSTLLRASVTTALLSLAGAAFAATSDFVIQDIRIEGIARTEPGTVLSHLPFQVGDEFTDAKGNTAIHSLFGSGLFRDVRLERDGNVLVIQLQERPAVAPVFRPAGQPQPRLPPEEPGEVPGVVGHGAAVQPQNPLFHRPVPPSIFP